MPDDKSPLAGLEKKDPSLVEGGIKVPEAGIEEKGGNEFEIPGTPEQSRVEAEKDTNAKAFGEQMAEAGGIVQAGNYASTSLKRKKEIEKILEDGLEDVFSDLSPEKQREFGMAGEETAARINELFDTAKVKAKKIIKLIKKWLMILPGINKFFLEQEVKIKTDEILKLKNKF
jgi:hypothetical protein